MKKVYQEHFYTKKDSNMMYDIHLQSG